MLKRRRPNRLPSARPGLPRKRRGIARLAMASAPSFAVKTCLPAAPSPACESVAQVMPPSWPSISKAFIFSSTTRRPSSKAPAECFDRPAKYGHSLRYGRVIGPGNLGEADEGLSCEVSGHVDDRRIEDAGLDPLVPKDAAGGRISSQAEAEQHQSFRIDFGRRKGKICGGPSRFPRHAAPKPPMIWKSNSSSRRGSGLSPHV